MSFMGVVAVDSTSVSKTATKSRHELFYNTKLYLHYLIAYYKKVCFGLPIGGRTDRSWLGTREHQRSSCVCPKNKLKLINYLNLLKKYFIKNIKKFLSEEYMSDNEFNRFAMIAGIGLAILKFI